VSAPELVPVFLTSAVRTSDGPGPGVKHLPPAEANRLISMRYAVGGDQPPRGYQDGGASGQAVGLMMPNSPDGGGGTFSKDGLSN